MRQAFEEGFSVEMEDGVLVDDEILSKDLSVADELLAAERALIKAEAKEQQERQRAETFRAVCSSLEESKKTLIQKIKDTKSFLEGLDERLRREYDIVENGTKST